MGKKQTITWRFIVSLGLPLIVVGAAAMAISYATLIDVARINGLPLPELFPILVDVGTVAAMVAAAQFKLRGIKGRWLAYVTFMALSGVSIVANAVHAMNTADLTKTSVMFAAVLAATPPATLLAVTHLVMMLIPTPEPQIVRVKLQPSGVAVQVPRIEDEAITRQMMQPVIPAPTRQAVQVTGEADNGTPEAHTPAAKPETAAVSAPGNNDVIDNTNESKQPTVDVEDTPANAAPVNDPIEDMPVAARVGTDFNQTGLSKEETTRLVLLHIEEMGTRPTGAQVAKWLGKAPRTGHRFLTKLEEDNIIQPATGEQKILLSK